MINRLTGFFCVSLLLIGGTAVRAQQAPPAPEATPDPQQSTPMQQAPPTPQPPAAPSTPSTSTQAPATQTGPQVNTAPQPPKYPDVRLPGEYGFWIGVNGWIPREQPIFDKGHASTFTQSSDITMQGHPKVAEGAEFGVALGLHNALRFNYFRTRASGDLTESVDKVVPSQIYSAGTLISTDYLVQSFNLSFEYLTWPYPVESRRFRLMTLWQFEYLTVRPGFDAPLLPLTDSSGNPLIGSDGNPITYTSQISKSIYSPMLGIGMHEYASKHVRLEFNTTGFLVPHHWTIWQADVTANFRISHFEIGVGAKAFHYKTSPEQDFFVRNTMASPFVSLKWFSQ